MNEHISHRPCVPMHSCRRLINLPDFKDIDSHAAHDAYNKTHACELTTGLTAMISPSLCPVCGARNDCALASPDLAAHPCWCFNVSINPERLKALPVEQLNVTCLCPRCADVQRQLPSAPPQGLA